MPIRSNVERRYEHLDGAELQGRITETADPRRKLVHNRSPVGDGLPP